MKGALIILAVTVLTGIILYIFDRRGRRTDGVAKNQPLPAEGDGNASDNAAPAQDSSAAAVSEEAPEGECCGLHLVCEKELTAIENGGILYYDDEELDRFADMNPEDYTEADTEEFRDVLMTLLPQDVPGWARSLDARHIRPPQEIRDELIILLRDITG